MNYTDEYYQAKQVLMDSKNYHNTDVLLAKTYVRAYDAAINYTHCCTQLLCVDKWCYNNLTKGSKYKLITEDEEYYTIVDDWGEICQRDKDLFEIIKQ